MGRSRGHFPGSWCSWMLKAPQNTVPGLPGAPWGHGRVMLLGGLCRDHDTARTPTPLAKPQLHLDLCFPEIPVSGPSEPPLKDLRCLRILPKQALISGVSLGQDEQ